MGNEVRLGQLITPFGPGSLYTEKTGSPTIVCGLDYWFKKSNLGQVVEIDVAKENSLISEPRLSGLLKVGRFYHPPEIIYDREDSDVSGLKIQSHRFPRWYVNGASGQLKKFNLETQRLDKPEKGSWKPVRFVTVCSVGHIDDFPWKEWCGCTCNNEKGLVLHDSGGVDLGSIKVGCSICNQSKPLSGVMAIERDEKQTVVETGLSRVGIPCMGGRPWLGDQAREGGCGEPAAAVLINQSNIYFSKVITSIYLPDLEGDDVSRKIQDILVSSGELSNLKLYLSIRDEKRAVEIARELVTDVWDGEFSESDDTILSSIKTALEGGASKLSSATEPQFPESEVLSYRRQEFNILRTAVKDGVSTELRVIESKIPELLTNFLVKVNLVERLRETRVFFGFDRLVRDFSPLRNMPDSAMRQLFLHPPEQQLQWLPAVKNYGEGIYIELSEGAINEWFVKNETWLKIRFDETFVGRMAVENLLLPPLSQIDWKWAARYQLVHTLSHVLINQLVFDSGYSSAAIKERIFVSNDVAAPMAGMLLYTASGDSEGSLGGLVRMGHPALLEQLFSRAIARASWCSADPVCSENIGGVGSRQVNHAACHACALLPETACETINNGLDRGVVVGTPANRDVGFFHLLLDHIVT